MTSLENNFISATMDLTDEGNAEVRIWTELTGWPIGVKRPGMSVFGWREYYKTKREG